MKDVMAEIEKLFKQAEWRYDQSQEYPNEFYTGFTGDNAKWNCRGFIEDGVFVFLIMFANYVPADKRAEVAELICRLNNLYYIGSFQIDFTSGAMLFRVSSPVVPTDCISNLVTDLVRTGVLVADDCYKTVMKVAYGDTSPEQAVQELCTNTNETPIAHTNANSELN